MELETKFGTLYICDDPRNREDLIVLDSQRRTLFRGCSRSFIKKMTEQIKKAKTIGDWLSNYEDVCWDNNKNNLITFIRSYFKYDVQHDGQIVFDKEWFESNYNKIGKTYVMFEYSECWKEKGRNYDYCISK